MATEPTPQRAYRAACPNCGAPVEFHSTASAFAVCSFCRSTIVREGDALRKIGESAELFDDHSPLRLGASGRLQGAAFTLVGRLQYRYAGGTWNEWHALFDSGRSAWLSEDNGRYVLAVDVPLQLPPPESGTLAAGSRQLIDGKSYTVASKVEVTLQAAQGELPIKPLIGQSFIVADLRSERDEVGTLDYMHPDKPTWSVGRSVTLSDLKMTGLADASDKALSGKGLACPNCGSPIEVKLNTTQSIVCPQCHAVVNLTSPEMQDVGGALAHYAQDNGSEPLIPLGRIGNIALGGPKLSWQVVGYVERCEVDEDESSFWREYLLYHRTAGFAFIVDAEDGWSWTAPITGVPQGTGVTVNYQNVRYDKLYDYTGEITYVLGEFYWKLTRRERTYNTDYAGKGRDGHKRLNRERTGQGSSAEVVWSAGETLTADAVMEAFRLEPAKRAAMQRDAKPTAASGSLLLRVFFWGFLILVLIVIAARCSRDNCNDIRQTFGAASTEHQTCLANRRSGGYRSGGGSFGGFSSGGSHK